MTYAISVIGRDGTVECREDQPLLDALLRAGEWVPNSCNQGTCGTCKLRVADGSVLHNATSGAVLLDEERESGHALACQATPCSDVQLEVTGEVSSAVHHPMVDFSATVSRVEDIARDTRRVMLALDGDFAYSPGQAVSLWVPGHEDVHRQYSLASLPGSPEIELHVRREPEGLASDKWAFGSIEIGERVQLSGPLGDFTYDGEDIDKPLLLLGGGTGLAPLKGIALAALEENPEREVFVYHGVRTSDYLYDLDFWTELEKRHPGVRFTPAVSREEYNGYRGYVSDLLLEDLKSCRGMTGYLCGSDAFVDGVGKATKRRRLAPRRTFRERFTPAVAPAPA